MQVWNYLKLLYSSKHALSKHVCLFSLIGLLVLSLVKYTAAYGNLLLYHNFYISVPSSAYELWIYLFFICFLMIYLFGYTANFANNLLNNRTELIPEFSLKPFYYVVKIFPLYLCWNLYFILMGLVMFYKISNDLKFVYIFLILAFMFPFILIIQTIFIKNLRYSKEYFRPITIFKVIGKSFLKVVILDLQVLVMAALPVFALYKILAYSVPVKIINLNLPIKLCVICLIAYIFMIFVLIYQAGLCNIVKSYYKDYQS